MADVFHTDYVDDRLNKTLLKNTKFPEEKFAELETILNYTNERLNRYYNGWNGPVPEFKSDYDTYEKVVKNICKSIGIEYEPKPKHEIEGLEIEYNDYQKIADLLTFLEDNNTPRH